MAPLIEWFDKYEYIISLGKKLPLMDAKYKTDENSITGCQSKVWLHAELNQGLLYFSAASDTLITKGLIALIFEVCNQESPQTIGSLDLFFLDKIGLNSNLSPSRNNGLRSIISRIKELGIKNLND